jgi:hypothetical protein
VAPPSTSQVSLPSQTGATVFTMVSRSPRMNGHATALAVRTVPQGFWEFARYSLQLDKRPVAAVYLHIGYKLREPLTEIHSSGHSRGYPCIEAKLLIDIWAP